jgi:CRP/FNR family cyclic AMP-dependent transcriptional regulator
MARQPEILKSVPLFSLLDDGERAVLEAQVELKTFATRERVYKRGDPGGQAYVTSRGRVRAWRESSTCWVKRSMT